MVRTQIRLSEKQDAALRRIAAKQGLSKAELIRRSVERLILSNTELDDGARWVRALDAAGCVRSGLGDLAANHDRYLAEAYAE